MAEPSRILIVEDERIVARDLTDTLEDLGYEVVAAVATGEDAVARARSDAPTAILMDIRLAGAIDGIEAARQIQAERDVPIVYLTAHADDDTLRRARETQPFGYLLKPFRAVDLRCALEIAIHKHEIDTRLRERERWLSTTLRSIGDGVIATDAHDRVTLVNPVAEALTGWKHEEALGKTLDEILRLVDGADDAPVESPSRRARTRGEVVTLSRDTMLQARSGSRIAIHDSAAPIVEPGGAVVGGVMVFRDDTARRDAEDAVIAANLELEQRVVERTAQLAAATCELDAFSASIAHDLRAPLRGIDGFSQSLIEDHAAQLGPDGLGHLQRVRAATARMGQLIDDLLRLSRTACSPLVRAPVDLSALARLVGDGLRADRAVELTVEPGLVVQGDAGLLRILLENLLGNAWKFTARSAAPRVTVGAAPGGFYVRDNGVGFDAAHATRLFGAFQRFHPAAEFEGTGIGLAIAHRIVARHGGRIHADSQIGAGATFHIEL